MGPDIGSKEKEVALMEDSRNIEDENATLDPNDITLQSESNCQDKICDMEALSIEQTTLLDESDDLDLDIIGCADNHIEGPKSECNVSTESSSSFGDTLSGEDYGSLLDDEEVESQIYDGNGVNPMSNGYREVFPRKKKLTVHWRKFISPLMWRCRWLELQIKKLQSQSLEYDRELALYDRRKQSDYENFSVEGFDTKSLGFSSHAQRHRAMKRKKRKKIEETTDIASYMAHHNLFSYYEKKRSLADDMSMEDKFLKLDKTKSSHDDIDDFVTRTSASSLLGDNDNIVQGIFLKIEAAQSKVHKLKNRIDKVVNENPMKFSFFNRLNFLTYSDDPTSPEDGNDVLVQSLHEASQLIPKHEFGDVLIMPESAIKSHGEVILLPDMIESMDKTLVGLSCGSTEKVQIQNREVKEELDISEELKGQLIEQPQILEEQELVSSAAVSQADLTSKNTEPNMQPKVKSLPAVKSNISKKTRKWGRRKAGSSKRNRRASG